MPHRGIEPASAACRSNTLTTELHPHPSLTLMGDHPSIDKTIYLESSTLDLREKEPLTTDYTSSQIIGWLIFVCVVVLINSVPLAGS